MRAAELSLNASALRKAKLVSYPRGCNNRDNLFWINAKRFMFCEKMTVGKEYMQGKLIFIICALIASILLLGCKDFAISVNQKEIYAPPAIFTNYKIADTQLDACIEQTISDARVTSPEQLTQLNCSNAGIKSLAGLDTFYALEELNLADNQLVNIDELATLGRLKVLVLSNNQINKATPLLHLLHLEQLRIDNNRELTCGDLLQLASSLDHTVDMQLPSQCKP